MPKVKIARKSTFIDMTPMVDMAFLLVTFFMLTTQFKPDEPVKIQQPSSISTFKVRDKEITIITIDKDGRVFLDMKGKNQRYQLIENMVDWNNSIPERPKISLDENAKLTFSVLSSVGVPMSEMQQLLSLSSDDRKKMNQSGIPVDSTNNELTYWLLNARAVAPAFPIIVKGDVDANYTAVSKVIKTLTDQKIFTFSLLTNNEAPPEDMVQTPTTTK